MATILIERRNSRAAEWSRRCGYFALVLLFVASIGHRYGYVDTPPFLSVLGVVAALALFALACAIFGFARLWQRGDKAGRSSTAGASMALLALSPMIAGVAASFYYPALTDISTDTADPPSLPMAAAARSPAMNPIEALSADDIAQQARAYPEMTGRRFEATIDQVMAVVVAEAGKRGWSMRDASTPNEDAREAAVEMVTYTPVFAFADDAVVRLEEENEATFVDMRIVSRYGRNDLGSNARQISSFLGAIDQTLKEKASE
jgi:hypothetical protein